MNQSEPIFKNVFDTTWEKLPSVFQKRYSNRAFSDDIITVNGTMDIVVSKFIRLFAPILKWLNVLVPYDGKNIPVKVDFYSHPNSRLLSLKRTFYFQNNIEYKFNSTIIALGINDVIETVRFNIGWRTHYFYAGNKVVMEHKNFVLRLFNLNIPLPLTYLFGKIHAEEEMINDVTYRITMTITHPWFGDIYCYAGNFTFIENKS